MKSVIIVFFSLTFSLGVSSCYKKGGPWGIRGKGKTISETRTATGFDKINISEDANVYFVQDSIYSVEVTAQENILRLVETKVKGSELQITFTRNVWDHEEIKVLIHAPNLFGITISGRGDVNVEKGLKSSSLSMELSGSGNVTLASLEASSLKINTSGLSNVRINGGSVNSENITVSGLGDVDLLSLEAAYNRTNISGTGDVKVNVSQDLNVTISGSGDVSYKGHPTVTTDISGSGKLISLN